MNFKQAKSVWLLWLTVSCLTAYGQGGTISTNPVLNTDSPATNATELDTLPVRTIASVFQNETGTNELIHLQGTVLDQRMGEYLVIRDGTGSILVESAQMVTAGISRRVDVWGTPTREGGRTRLTDATFRTTDPLQMVWQNVAPDANRPAELPLLTNALQIRSLSPGQAAWHFPVRIHAVVTLFVPQRNKFYVQDETSGIYVRPQLDLQIRTGDLLEIEGQSDPGGFAPVIIPTKVTAVSPAPLPQPAHATPYQLASGQYNSQWMEARGVVRSQAYNNGLLQLKVSDSSGTYLVNIVTSNAPAADLLDGVVQVRGVCSSDFNSKRQIVGSAIWAPSPEFLTLEEAGPSNPFNQPEQSILSLSQFRPRELLPQRVKVSGIVTLCESSQGFYLQDQHEAVEVVTSQTNSLQPGDRVMVAGYPEIGEYGPVLQDAMLRVTGHQAVPAPRLVSSNNVLDPEMHGLWVQIDGQLTHYEKIADRLVMTLQSPGAVFEAQLPETNERKLPAVGSRLRLSGIYRVRADTARIPTSFQLIVPGSEAIQVLEEPSWWTVKHTFIVVGVLALLVTATTLWILMLRGKVQQQTAILKQSESKFRSLVEQSLVGVYVIQEGLFVYANPRMAEIFGYTVEEILQLGVLDLVTENDRELVQEQVRRRVEGEVTTVHYTFTGRRKDGSQIYVEVLGSRTEYNGKIGVLGTTLDITEQKRAQEELFKSQQMLRTVLDTIPQRVFWKDQNSVYVGCNKALAEDCGYSDPADLVGKSDRDTVSAELAQIYQQDDREVMQTGRAKINYEEPQIRADGSQRWLRTSKVPLFDPNGGVIGVLGTYEDITERKLAEAALAEASALLDALMDNSPDHIYFKDAESRFVRYSKSFAELLNLPDADAIKGKTDFDLFTEEHARPAFEDEQKIINTGEAIVGKLEKETHADGRVTWALTTKLPWRDKHGNIIGTFGISKDVTAIKEAETKLAYERELFQALLENLPDAIYFKDRDSRFVRVSASKVERSRRILLSRFHVEHPDVADSDLPEHLLDNAKCHDYLIGKTDFDVYSEERAGSAYKDEQQIIGTGQPIVGKMERTARHDGTFAWYLTTKMAWRDEQGNIIGTFGVSRDVSDIKDAEAKLEAAHQRLIETSRLAGMAEVATDVLHNVGNVLNSVNVSCSLTIDRVKASKVSSLSKISALLQENGNRLGEFFASDPRARQIPSYMSALAEHFSHEQSQLLQELEQLIKHIDHIKQIVAMQQSYAKVAGVIETVNPSQLVEDALHINAAALSRHDVHVECDFQEVPLIQTEKHKVLQILVNLIRNAKYALDEAKRPDKHLQIKISQNGGNHVKIQVADNGVGIPPENLTRIFAHGFTTRSNGHGFGLHSSALAIKELGGSLEAHSEGSGKGATFTLLLPHQPTSRINGNT